MQKYLLTCCWMYVHTVCDHGTSWRSVTVPALSLSLSHTSLVPRRRGGGGGRAPGTYCLCMRLIIAKATWQNLNIPSSTVHVNSINHHENNLRLCSQERHKQCFSCSGQFYTVEYKEKCLEGHGRKRLTELANNCIKVCSLVNTLIGGNLFYLELYLEVSSYQKAQNSSQSNRLPTSTLKAYSMR